MTISVLSELSTPTRIRSAPGPARPSAELRGTGIGDGVTRSSLAIQAASPQVEPAEQRYQGRLTNGGPLLLNLLGAAAQPTGRPLSGSELGAEISAQVVAEIATRGREAGCGAALRDWVGAA